MRRVYQLQRASAFALLALLLVHTHFVVHMPIDQPAWRIIDIAFLFAMLLHGLSGAYMVLAGRRRSRQVRRVTFGLIVAVGVIAFLYGASAILAFQPALPATGG